MRYITLSYEELIADMTYPERKTPADWVQVDSADHYFNLEYLTPTRFASIGYQLRYVHKNFAGESVLEIGPGSSLTTRLLQQFGHEVKTLDVDHRLEPDIISPIHEIPLENEAMGCFLCSQVLEHLPWDMVGPALSELHRVVRGGGVISVPTNQPTLLLMKFDTKNWGTRRLRLGSRRNKPMRTKGGQHYWELEANITLKEFEQKIRASGFRVIHKLQPVECMYHQFLVVEKA